MQNIREWISEVEQQELFHLEDEWHLDCAYCYAVEHGEMPGMPVSVCSVHMSWLENRYRNILYVRTDENK